MTVAAGCALLFFFWGLAKFIFNAGDAKGNQEGRQLMLWGVVALFVLLSVWGLVRFVQETLLGIETNTSVVALVDVTLIL